MKRFQDKFGKGKVCLEKEALCLRKEVAVRRRHGDGEVLSVCDARGEEGGFCSNDRTWSRAAFEEVWLCH